MKYAVTIPDWSDGCSLRVENIEPAPLGEMGRWTGTLRGLAEELMVSIRLLEAEIGALAPEWFAGDPPAFIEDAMARPLGHPMARSRLADLRRERKLLARLAVEARVVEWVNERAGRHYCDRLPAGAKIVEQAED